MPTPEEQRLLDQLNRDQQRLDIAGWIAFFLGTLFTSLLFVLIFIPIAQQEAVHEFQRTQSTCQTN